MVCYLCALLASERHILNAVSSSELCAVLSLTDAHVGEQD